jgi:tetratricopeptide (TPR) repeat protein
MSSDWYAGRFPVPGGSAPHYARSLTPNESLGVVEYNVGNERRRQFRLEAARSAYLRSVRLFPQFAEAHASLGTTLQLLGRLDEASHSYQAARAADPHLAGVDWNIAVLDEERARPPR